MQNDEQRLEKLRNLSAEAVLDLRRAYLAEHGKRVVLKHWEHLQSAAQEALTLSSTPERWLSEVCLSLQIPVPHYRSGSCRSSIEELIDHVHMTGSAMAWRDLFTREYAYIMVLARSLADARREQLEEKNVRDETIPPAV